MNWVFTNKKEWASKAESIINKDIKSKVFCVNSLNNLGKDCKVIVDGYALPRNQYFDEDRNIKKYILNIYKKYGDSFINRVKGVFNIIIIDNNTIKIFNDRNSVKRFFYYSNDTNIICSNSIKVIANTVSAEISIEKMALFSIMEHFVEGNTMYEKIFYSTPATFLKINEDSFIQKCFWNPSQLLEGNRNKSISDIKDTFVQSIKNQINYQNLKNISTTLTGGNDSRMIYSILKSFNIKLNSFSYGNPESLDCVIAKQISSIHLTNYNNYYVCSNLKSWFQQMSNHIISFGCSMINIHRAHRLDAMIKEQSKNNPDAIVTGLMGGEYIKGVAYDDYIIPKIVRLYEENNCELTRLILINILEEKKIRTENIDVDKLLGLIKSFHFFNEKNKKRREFLYAFNIYSSSHHAQDSQVISHVNNIVINPFMDVDNLEVLSKSIFFSANLSKNGIYNKVYSSTLQVKIAHDLTPELSNIPYAKKGLYTAKLYLGNPIIDIFNRFKNRKIQNKYPANFPYSTWIKEFCIEKMENINSCVNRCFDIHAIENEIEKDTFNISSEKSWHLVTNPINLHLYIEQIRK